MTSRILLAVHLCVLNIVIPSPYVISAQESEEHSIFSEISNQINAADILTNDTKDRYLPDEINDVIYRLNDDIQNNNTDIEHFQAVAILIDFICSNESYESIIEACDVVTELPGLAD